MRIRDLLATRSSNELAYIRPDCTLCQAAERMTHSGIGCLLVIDSASNVCGIISERDLVKTLAQHANCAATMRVEQVMTKQIIQCDLDDKASNVLRRMNVHSIRHVPVISNNRPVSMISIRELIAVCSWLEERSNVDGLTQLSNRRHFLENLSEEFQRCKRYKHPLSVATIDIDHFKRVNDSYGHAAGDKVLKKLGDILRNTTRTTDKIGRIGGEEFAVAFVETDLDDAAIVCNRIISIIHSIEVDWDDIFINFTVSIGLAKSNPMTEDEVGALRRSDELLYSAKSLGRDRLITQLMPGHSCSAA